jgi:hypothetical protein
MSKLSNRGIEYRIIVAVGLVLLISGIFLLSFNWIISIVLFSVALGIPLIYYFLTSLRVKLKIWRLIPNAQSCIIFLCVIISAILIISTVSVMF